MTGTKLRRAVLFAKDVAVLHRFYRDCLGLPEVSVEDGFVVLGTHGAELALHAIPADIAAEIVINTPPDAREETPIKLVFVIEDVQAALALVPKFGGELRKMHSAGADALDPEGNVFHLTSTGT